MPAPFIYKLFGFTIASELECPELLPSDEQPEVRISFGTIPTEYDENNNLKAYWKATPDYFFFTLKNISKFLVTDGKNILIETSPAAELDQVRLFLLGTCFGALMHQRGLFLLHGSSIVLEEDCIIFTGPVGVGKSTIAAAFKNKGYQVLTDDVCAISFSHVESEWPMVYPGYPQLKLTPASLKKTHHNINQLQSVSSDTDKYRLPIINEFHTAPSRLRAICILDTHDVDTFSLDMLYGTNKFQQLMKNIYRGSLVNELGLQRKYFKNFIAINKKTECYHFHRPNKSFLLNESVTFLEKALIAV